MPNVAEASASVVAPGTPHALENGAEGEEVEGSAGEGDGAGEQADTGSRRKMAARPMPKRLENGDETREQGHP